MTYLSSQNGSGRAVRFVTALTLVSSLALGALAAEAPAQAAAPDRSSDPAALPFRTGPQFLAIFDNLVLPDTYPPVGAPPSITGNSAADARIRAISESRGYRRRPASNGVLVNIDGASLHPSAANALHQMKGAAAAVGIPIWGSSGYRSPDTQRSIFMGRLTASPAQIAAGQADGAVHAVLEWSAAPGYSKHQTGYAIDLAQGSGSLTNFGSTAAAAWLSANNYANARWYGFVPSYPPDGGAQGPNPEPWEYVYVGTEASGAVSPFGSIDAVEATAYGQVRVSGWAIDPSWPPASTEIHVYVGGFAGAAGTVGTNLGPASGFRPDVAAAYPDAGAAHGFSGIASSGTKQGRVPVCVYAINIGAGSNALLGCRDVTLVAGDPFGYIDTVSGLARAVHAQGWAIDPDTTTPVEIWISVDGGPVTSSVADRPRPDLGTMFPAHAGASGFDVTVAAPPGQREVCIRAINAPGTGGGNPRLGCRSVWVTDPDAAFVDLLSDSPFHPAIAALVSQGVIDGYPDGTFRPTAPVSRQGAAAFLYRSAGSPEVTTVPPFLDVAADHPFAAAIAWAASTGIIAGYGDGTFQPTRTVTRQAMVAMIWRAAGGPAAPPDPATSFSDVAADHPFAAAIAWAAGTGIIAGYGDGTFRPTVPLSRQAAAATLMRAGAVPPPPP